MIQDFRTAIDGQLSDKTRVVDNLLDLRLATADQPAMVAEVDRLLSDVPGLTTVENSWWSAALDDLRLTLSAVPMA